MSFSKDEKTTVVSSEAESNAGEREQSFEVQTSSIDEPQYDFDSEEFSSIPELVRNVVSFEDDSTLPVITFRSVLLSIVFCIIGSVISQMSYFRTTTAAFPVFFVILVSQPLGRLLARVLPDYTVPLGRFSFTLNPGPFSIKEHAIIGIAANSGSQGQWARGFSLGFRLCRYGYPYSVQLVIFVGFVITTWILIPIAYFGNIWGSPTYDIMSNTLYTKNGTDYPFQSLHSSGNQQVNETRYEEIGLSYAGAQYTWGIFMWYASYISSYVWAGLFLAPKIWNLWKNRNNLAKFRTDRLNRIIQKYPDVTKWEWLALGVVPFVLLLIIVCTDSVWMSWWTYLVALGFGASAMLPMSLVYAISGYSMKVGIFNELIYGYMIEAKGSSHHPLGQLAYRIISGNTWYDSRSVLEDQKAITSQIGHYLHIPPRDVIGVQIVANMVALPVNYGVMRWVLAAKHNYLTGALEDPSGQWTAQDFQSYNTEGIMYALVGPRRLFASSYFSPVLYGFLVGCAAPAAVWLLHRRFPRARFDLWNTTIFFASAATFRGNLSTGPFTSTIVGTVFNYYLYRYRHLWWNKWAYISGAALDTGYNLNLLFVFLFLGTTGTVMVNWWGNNAVNSERCFALDS
ncbi:hypothetical protein VSDG_00013 [Cytospora chrysosperma]|uniref:OPT family small oligopeptide transporter n=1 Tax=Cytospora chrysosperma TaxID=252740 RepID=A0A423WPR8_CYTCH|nr:hypothetical protein VSDG_00013 [Valsa sordida]